jgi:hypothetical protein
LIGTQPHARDRGLQIVRDGGEQPHAFVKMRIDAGLHGVEGTGGLHHFLRAVLGQRCGAVAGFERVGGIGQLAHGLDGQPHAQPGRGQQGCQLQRQQEQRRARDHQPGWRQNQAHGRAIAQVHGQNQIVSGQHGAVLHGVYARGTYFRGDDVLERPGQGVP